MSDDPSIDHGHSSQPEAAGAANTGTAINMRRRKALVRLTQSAAIAVPLTLGVMSMTRAAPVSGI